MSFRVSSGSACQDRIKPGLWRFRRSRGGAVALCCSLSALTGCGSGAHRAASVNTPTTFSHARFVAADFVSPIAAQNQYLPLKPGRQSVRGGTTLVGHRAVPHIVVSTVTDVIRRIDGVRAVAVLDQDIDAGEVTQQSIDWRAQDRSGNIWSVGSYTEEYEGGRFSMGRDAWLAGVNGGKAGLMTPVNLLPQAPPWTIAQPLNTESDVAQAVARGVGRCVAFNCYKDVLTVREGKSSALLNELKYYAPGVGQVLNTPMVFSHHKDVEELVNLIQLTPSGLAEISAEVLKLDRHARITAPGVYDLSVASQRLR